MHENFRDSLYPDSFPVSTFCHHCSCMFVVLVHIISNRVFSLVSSTSCMSSRYAYINIYMYSQSPASFWSVGTIRTFEEEIKLSFLLKANDSFSRWKGGVQSLNYLCLGWIWTRQTTQATPKFIAIEYVSVNVDYTPIVRLSFLELLPHRRFVTNIADRPLVCSLSFLYRATYKYMFIYSRVIMIIDPNIIHVQTELRVRIYFNHICIIVGCIYMKSIKPCRAARFPGVCQSNTQTIELNSSCSEHN